MYHQQNYKDLMHMIFPVVKHNQKVSNTTELPANMHFLDIHKQV